MKGNMRDKTNKKKDKHENKVRDLKPVKDPKGGTPPGPPDRPDQRVRVNSCSFVV